MSLKKCGELLEECHYLYSEEIKKRCAKPGSEADFLFKELDEIALQASSIYHTAITLQWKIIMASRNPLDKLTTLAKDTKEVPKPTSIEGLAQLLAQSGVKPEDIGDK